MNRYPLGPIALGTLRDRLVRLESEWRATQGLKLSLGFPSDAAELGASARRLQDESLALREALEQYERMYGVNLDLPDRYIQ